MKLIQIIVLAFFVFSCAPIRVNYDFDRGTDFNKYKTYNYFSDMQTGLSELDSNRFLDALDVVMKNKGLSLSDTPDFFIDIKSTEYQNVQRSNLGVGLGGGGGHMGGGISIGIPVGQTIVNRQIIIDFVDVNGRGLFWQAISESSYNPNALPEQREEQLNAIIQKVFLKYPPKQ